MHKKVIRTRVSGAKKRISRARSRAAPRVRRRLAATRSTTLNTSDRRILGLASEVIAEDQGLLRRLAER
jgi:hypothetical protein